MQIYRDDSERRLIRRRKDVIFDKLKFSKIFSLPVLVPINTIEEKNDHPNWDHFLQTLMEVWGNSFLWLSTGFNENSGPFENLYQWLKQVQDT